MARWGLVMCLVLAALLQINADGTSNAQTAVTGLLKNMMDTTKDQTQSLINGIGQQKAGLVDRTKTEELTSIVNQLPDKLTALAKAAEITLDATVSAAANVINTAVGTINSAVGAVVTTLSDVVSALGEVLKAVLDLVASLLNVVLNLLGNLLGGINNVLTGLLAQVLKLSNSVTSSLEQTIHPQLKLIEQSVDQILDFIDLKLIPAVKSLSQAVLTLLAEVLYLVARIGQLVTDLLNGILYELFGVLSSVGSTLQNVLGSAVGTITGVLSAVTGCPGCLNGPLSKGNGGGLLGLNLGKRRRSVVKPLAF
ncbi:unnamed protein product [Adineta ricciae]|uniref:Uncharacterized protein n=1 Tax=Adineta ricciae TaxID=249248 RepID=A0A815BTQ1_ADIRI|nr:unnamed protein product [Adineta ricciae]CAF1404725.1 unnamed protein product [Adineta ricciae]